MASIGWRAGMLGNALTDVTHQWWREHTDVGAPMQTRVPGVVRRGGRTPDRLGADLAPPADYASACLRGEIPQWWIGGDDEEHIRYMMPFIAEFFDSPHGSEAYSGRESHDIFDIAGSRRRGMEMASSMTKRVLWRASSLVTDVCGNR